VSLLYKITLGNRAFTALSSTLSLELGPAHSQLAVIRVEAIMLCLSRDPQITTDTVLNPCFQRLLHKPKKRAIIPLVFFTNKLLQHCEAECFAETVWSKLTGLLTDSDATIRAAASQGLTELEITRHWRPRSSSILLLMQLLKSNNGDVRDVGSMSEQT